MIFIDKGAFTIYVYNTSHIFDHPPTFIYNFYAINVYKHSSFLNTHPAIIISVNSKRPLSRTKALVIRFKNPPILNHDIRKIKYEIKDEISRLPKIADKIELFPDPTTPTTAVKEPLGT